MSARLSAAFRAASILLVVTAVTCQYPMPFPFPPQPGHMGSPVPMQMPMGQIPPLPPQNFIPPAVPMNYPMPRRMASVVMPYYSKSKNKAEKKYRKRKRKSKKYDYSSETDSEESASGEFNFRRSKKRRQVLTPVVSYVTKDGYVVYQKEIKKDKAKDWLEMTKKKRESQEVVDSAEEKKFRRMMKRMN